MITTKFDSINTEVLIVGSGLAGLLSALHLAKFGLKVTIVSKDKLMESNTAYAQGGLAAVVQESIIDSPAKHLEDTIKCGAGLTDEIIARLILQEGAHLISELTALGINFDKCENNQFDLAREGGHSQARVLHCKDTTGRSIVEALKEQINANSKITVFENAFAEQLIVKDNICQGAYLRINGQRQAIFANYVMLATGGIGQVFSRTTNPEIATGDGIAMAYRAGAELVDMEFVQFHPTALYKPGASVFLISEAVRGAGAQLLDKQGKRFVHRFHKDGELATRDVIARAINTVMQEESTDFVWLDLRPIGKEKLVNRFPNILATCQKWGIDPLVEPIPVAPAAHYLMGGIRTNRNGLTSVYNLYALGECAATGLHGANRLASNSLLEAGVMAMRVARAIANDHIGLSFHNQRQNRELTTIEIPQDYKLIREQMYLKAGLLRSTLGLKQLLKDFSKGTMQKPISQCTEEEIMASNVLLLAKIITHAALERRESRGAHWRLDYPQTDDLHFQKRQIISQTHSTWLPMEEPGKQGSTAHRNMQMV